MNCRRGREVERETKRETDRQSQSQRDREIVIIYTYVSSNQEKVMVFDIF